MSKSNSTKNLLQEKKLLENIIYSYSNTVKTKFISLRKNILIKTLSIFSSSGKKIYLLSKKYKLHIAKVLDMLKIIFTTSYYKKRLKVSCCHHIQFFSGMFALTLLFTQLLTNMKSKINFFQNISFQIAAIRKTPGKKS